MSLSLDSSDIEAILPHREPFLFVDAVRSLVPGESIVGELRVDGSKRFLTAGNGARRLPETILAEAMAQVGAILVLYPEENRGRTIYFRAIDEASFEHRVPEGTTVRIEAEVKRMRARLGTLNVRAYVNDDQVAHGVMRFALG